MNVQGKVAVEKAAPEIVRIMEEFPDKLEMTSRLGAVLTVAQPHGQLLSGIQRAAIKAAVDVIFRGWDEFPGDKTQAICQIVETAWDAVEGVDPCTEDREAYETAKEAICGCLGEAV